MVRFSAMAMSNMRNCIDSPFLKEETILLALVNPQAVFSKHNFCAENFIDGLFDAGEHRNFGGVIVAGEDAAAADFGEPGENVLLDV